MTRPRLALPSLAAVAAIAVAGCGGTSTTRSGAKPEVPKPPGGAVAPTGTIPIKGFKFMPATAQARVGQKVTWTNMDSAAHNIIADDETGPQSPTLKKGQSYTFTPAAPGTYTYVCSFHPFMKGTLTVK